MDTTPKRTKKQYNPVRSQTKKSDNDSGSKYSQVSHGIQQSQTKTAVVSKMVVSTGLTQQQKQKVVVPRHIPSQEQPIKSIKPIDRKLNTLKDMLKREPKVLNHHYKFTQQIDTWNKIGTLSFDNSFIHKLNDGDDVKCVDTHTTKNSFQGIQLCGSLSYGRMVCYKTFQIYEGMFQNYNLIGYGRAFYPDGSFYLGEFQKNLKSG